MKYSGNGMPSVTAWRFSGTTTQKTTSGNANERKRVRQLRSARRSS